MKIVLVASYYADYLKNFEYEHATHDLNYHEHQSLLFADYYGAFISYRNHFRRLGHECELLIDNHYEMQQKWLDERSIKVKANAHSKHQIVMKQLEAFQPDVFFVGSMFDYYNGFLHQVKKNITPNIFTWIACPFPKTLDFSPVKCVLTSVPNFLSGIEASVELLRAAFDTDIVKNAGSVDKTIATSFVGSLSSQHQYRIKCLESLMKNDFDLMLRGNMSLGRFSWLRRNPLKSILEPAVWGMDMYRTLMQSYITLNFHIDVARASGVVGNMRTYEATGCGTLLLADAQQGIEKLFVPDKEIVTFSSLEELQEKTQYYLRHKNECLQIAQAGQKACFAKHSYGRRIVEFEKILLKYME